MRDFQASYLAPTLFFFVATAIAAPRYAANEKVTPIVGKSTDGAAISIDPTPRHLILLSFYFSGCGYCIKELPYLNRFAKAHPKVRVVAVTFDSAQEAKRFAHERGVDFEVVADAQAFIDKVGVPEYPYIMLLSPEGKPVSAIHGATSVDRKTNDTVDVLDSWFDRVAPET